MDNLFTTTESGKVNGVKRITLYKILREAGYRNLSDGGMLNDSILCKESKNKIELANLDELWDYVLSFADGRPYKEDIILKYKESMHKRIVSMLDRTKYIPYKDDRNTCRLFFNNGVLEIYRKTGSVKLIPWSDFNTIGLGKVWSDSISKVDIEVPKLKEYQKGVFYKFCKNTVGGGEGMRKLMIALGYLFHSYKDESRPYIIVFSDGDETDNNKSSGGTGKTLIASHLVKCVRNQSFIDGKKYKSDSSFALQTVDKYADTVLIDDVDQKFSYRSLYPATTGTMTIEKKGLTPVQVAYEYSPKIIVTSNYGLIANDVSDQRRRRVIGISGYYGLHRTPSDEFGHNFFREWVDEREIEWQYCFGFISACVMEYFKNNCKVESHNHTNIETKALANAQDPDLMEYCIDNYAKYLGKENDKTHNDWNKLVTRVTGRVKGAEWKTFKKAMEAIGLKSSIGRQAKDGNKNVRKYHFEVDDIKKLHRVLKGANVEQDHNGVSLIQDPKLSDIPPEFKSE